MKHLIAGAFVLAGLALAACGQEGDDSLAPQVEPIVNGTFDGTTHPMVGALLYDFDANGTATNMDLLCSGAFVGPARSGIGHDGQDVFLTAAHCVADLPPAAGRAKLWVTFDNDLIAAGVTGAVEAASVVFDPAYGHDNGDLHDLALVFLPAGAAVGISRATLPSAGRLDLMARGGGLRGKNFENVGYGADAAFKKGRPRISYPDRRLVSTSPFMALTRTWLGLLINNDATGQGGDCFGDSGSAKFIPGTTTIVATVSWGDVNCRATSWNYRLDTPSARGFLGQYLTLP